VTSVIAEATRHREREVLSLQRTKPKTALVSSSSNTAGGRLFYMLLILRLFVSCSSCGKRHADITGIVIVSTSVVSSF
jgi:hypothetical protein